jgi:hypothetical protein
VPGREGTRPGRADGHPTAESPDTGRSSLAGQPLPRAGGGEGRYVADRYHRAGGAEPGLDDRQPGQRDTENGIQHPGAWHGIQRELQVLVEEIHIRVQPHGAGEHAVCADNGDTEVQLVRTFWDLRDKRADGLDTVDVAQTRANILRSWDEFIDSPINHGDREGGNDGGNMWDYFINAGWDLDAQSDTLEALQESETICQSIT